jgi:N-acetylneuraminate lyase
MKTFRLPGLCAAAVTPFDEHGKPRLEQVSPIVDSLIRRGVSGLYVCGSTGEGVSQTDAERMAVAEAYVNAAGNRLPVVVQVGQNSLTAARELAYQAQAIGADGISATCPSYFKINDLELLVDAMTYVASSVPDLPFYYYHIPALTGVDFDMVEFLRLAGPRNPNLVGLKFTTPLLHQYQQCLELDGGRFDILWGVDEMLLAALATGAAGAIGSTYNIAAPVYLRIIEAFERGDLATARQWQARAIRFIGILASFPFHSALREVMRLQGLDCGHCRLPMRPLTANERAALKAELDAIEFFAWCDAELELPPLRRDATKNGHNGHPVKPPSISTRPHETI